MLRDSSLEAQSHGEVPFVGLNFGDATQNCSDLKVAGSNRASDQFFFGERVERTRLRSADVVCKKPRY